MSKAWEKAENFKTQENLNMMWNIKCGKILILVLIYLLIQDKNPLQRCTGNGTKSEQNKS